MTDPSILVATRTVLQQFALENARMRVEIETARAAINALRTELEKVAAEASPVASAEPDTRAGNGLGDGLA